MNFPAKKMLLLDGIGALVTASLLSLILAPYESLFGMPKQVLYILAGIAFCFALYSFSCHLFLKRDFEFYLKIIMSANILYCVATFTLMFLYFESLTWLGIAYFSGEILVVLILVLIEYFSIKREEKLI